MPLDFPASPSVNDTYTFSDRTWKWNGEGWQLDVEYTPPAATGVSLGLLIALS